MATYSTNFTLEYPVRDLEAAREYLTEDDMTQYLHGSFESLEDAVRKIEWILDTEMRGRIVVETTRELHEVELIAISRWISGQNSDGLGEGFEQQDFANYPDPEFSDEYEDDCDTWIMASFDWESNEYKLEKVG